MAKQPHIHDDETALFQAAAERFAELATSAAKQRGAFHVALAGGSTPKGLYRLLAEAPYRSQIPWQQVHIWFGDERCVPPEDAHSNYRMAKQALLDQVGIPEAHIHRMQGEIDPEKAANDYVDELKQHHSDSPPALDLVLLGTGPDGHIASLFPGTDILTKRKPVAAVYVPKLECWRISLTYPVLNAARHVMILISGNKKADVVRHIFNDRNNANPLPIQMLKPRGDMEWYLDRAAARHIASPKR